MSLTGQPDSEFGHWNNLNERLQELSNRLTAWFVSGEQLPELFTNAGAIMINALYDLEDPLKAPKELILQSFEDALDTFDHLLSELPATMGLDAWNENPHE